MWECGQGPDFPHRSDCHEAETQSEAAPARLGGTAGRHRVQHVELGEWAVAAGFQIPPKDHRVLGYSPLRGPETPAERLVHRRRTLGMSQNELASEIGAIPVHWRGGSGESGGRLARCSTASRLFSAATPHQRAASRMGSDRTCYLCLGNVARIFASSSVMHFISIAKSSSLLIKCR
jgi:hypothetical protein